MKKNILSFFIFLGLFSLLERPLSGMKTWQAVSSYGAPVVEALWPHTWYSKMALGGAGLAFGISFFKYSTLKGLYRSLGNSPSSTSSKGAHFFVVDKDLVGDYKCLEMTLEERDEELADLINGRTVSERYLTYSLFQNFNRKDEPEEGAEKEEEQEEEQKWKKKRQELWRKWEDLKKRAKPYVKDELLRKTAYEAANKKAWEEYEIRIHLYNQQNWNSKFWTRSIAGASFVAYITAQFGIGCLFKR